MSKDIVSANAESAGAFKARLEACRDAREVDEAVRLRLDSICREYIQDEPDADKRELADGLFSAARAGAGLISGMSEARISYKPIAAKTGAKKMLKWVALLPALLCAALGVWLLFDEKWVMAALALVSGAMSAIQALIAAPGSERKMEPVAAPAPNANDICRAFEKTLITIAARLEARGPEEDADARGAFSVRELEAAQMLMEARATNDGEYALKAVPGLVSALGEMGAEFENYTDDNASDFELLPGLAEGITIRPAVRRGEKLILRGQATFKAGR